MNMHREIKRRDSEIADLKEKLAGLMNAIAVWKENPTTGNEFALKDAAASIVNAGSEPEPEPEPDKICPDWNGSSCKHGCKNNCGCPF